MTKSIILALGMALALGGVSQAFAKTVVKKNVTAKRAIAAHVYQQNHNHTLNKPAKVGGPTGTQHPGQ